MPVMPQDTGSLSAAVGYFGTDFKDTREYSEEFAAEGIFVQRPVLTSWADRHKLVSDALGVVLRFGTNNISRRLPAQHPSTHLSRLRCITATGLKGEGAMFDMIQLATGDSDLQFGFGDLPFAEIEEEPPDGNARVTFNYMVPPYLVKTDAEINQLQPPKELGRYVQRHEESDAVYIPLPGKMLSWVNAPHDFIEESSVKLFPAKELIYIAHDWPDLPWGAMDSVLGKVNIEPFDGPAWGGYKTYPAGTLLYLGGRWEPVPIRNPYQPQPTRFRSEYWLYRIFHKFQYRKEGHNKFFRVSTQRFEPVIVDSTGQPPFEEDDFKTLFELPNLL